MFQAKKWGWKRLATRLLLVPVLAGGSAATTHAQLKSAPGATMPRAGARMPGSARTPAGKPSTGQSGDPKQILKDGRKALAEGRFNDAQDLAQAAAANNPTGKWGLFDDTPNSLLKDVQSARRKADKAQSAQLLKQAKTLLSKPCKNKAERAYNLDNALQMARRADQLHGPYTIWDLGDRADKLVKDLEDERSKLGTVGSPVVAHPKPAAKGASSATATRPSAPKPSVNAPNSFLATKPASTPVHPPQPAVKSSPVTPVGGAFTPPPLTDLVKAPPMPKSVAQIAATPKPPAPVAPVAATPKPPAPVAPVAATPKPPAPVDAKKAKALKLMAEGKQHADRAEFAEAKAKFLEADRCGAVFTVREPNPGFAIQELNARGSSAINTLVREAHSQIKKKDFEKANASLVTAAQITKALGLFPRPVEEACTALKTVSQGQYTGQPQTSVAIVPTSTPATPAALPPVNPVATAPVAPVVRVAPIAPAANPASPPGSAVVTAVKPLSGTVEGRQLLDQAAMAFKAGDYDVAARLARQAYNLGSQQDATALLNSIDAEKLALKKRTAEKSFEAAMQAHAHHDFGHALSVFVLIDPNLLPTEKKGKLAEMMAACRVELDKTADPDTSVVATGATQLPMASTPSVLEPAAPNTPQSPGAPATPPALNAKGTNLPGSARVGGPSNDPNNLAHQVEAMHRVTFQKLRSEGLKVQSDAQSAFGRGDTDVAIQMLVDFSNRVRSAEIEKASMALLLRPVENRLEMFRVMKGQTDALSREKREKQEAKELIVGRGAAEEQRKAEVARLVRDCNRYLKASDYAMAEKTALQAKQLDPDNEAVIALATMTKMQRRVKEQEALKNAKEKLVYEGLTGAEQPGPYVDTNEPVAVQIERMKQARSRGSLDDVYLRRRSPREFEIELKLDKPVTVEFTQTPLELAVENLRSLTGLPIMFDQAALDAEGLSAAKPITVKPGAAISARNILHVALEQAGMSFVIEHDMVKITTVKRSKGRLFTKVFSVADLVTPIPNFALPDYANLDKMLGANPINRGNVQLQGMNGPSPYMAPNSLGGGAPAGSMAGNPGIAGNLNFGPGGSIQTAPAGNGSGPSPLNRVGTVGSDTNTKHEQLIKLITGMIRPYTWDGVGGNGRIEYYDIGSALVVNQTADVIREVADLLEALRRLQDLAVAVEIRIVSLSETFFERMGVDFSMNIKTNSNTAKFEPQLTSGIFRPEPFINDIAIKGTTVGLTPAGSFTPDLDVPIRSTSFGYAIPGFGGYPNNPANDGGVSLGLAFLNDIQVYMFMEASQGDRRVNVMQAPKITLFNGQTATLAVQALSFFVTQVSVVSVNGQIVFIPSNTPLPGPDTNFNIGVQAVVSADRRFVRLNLPVTLAAQSGATVPLFPVTTFITPVFEGGSQGVPIPFTQFLQQPGFTTLTLQTTVVCPDGGTVLLGGLKTLQEGRNEFGPPFLSKVPYVNRLFKNVGIGRETTHIMIMVTPRIIINSEEEIRQTEGGALGTGAQ